tara:strand:+ start:463 stop:786 length:324 start_codon:yes stop_codon:yes gene_type:complete
VAVAHTLVLAVVMVDLVVAVDLLLAKAQEVAVQELLTKVITAETLQPTVEAVAVAQVLQLQTQTAVAVVLAVMDKLGKDKELLAAVAAEAEQAVLNLEVQAAVEALL